MIDPTHPGLKKHRMTTSTVVFMIFCLCAAGAYGIEDMIPNAGPGLTLVMLIVLPFVWSTPMGLVASELGSAIPEEGGFYKWVQRACGEFWASRPAGGAPSPSISTIRSTSYLRDRISPPSST